MLQGTDAKQTAAEARAGPPGDPGHQYLRVSLGPYILLFAVAFLFLSIFEIGVENRSEYGLRRIASLWHRNWPFAVDASPNDLPAMAQKLGVKQQELMTAQYIVETELNRLERESPNSLSRIVVWRAQDYTVFVTFRFFLNLLVATILAALFYYRRRGALAGELIGYQASKFSRVSQQLEARMAESTRIIEKLNRLQEKLVEAEKLASIGRLSATLAHEIRNPLTIMKSSLDLVQDDVRNGAVSEAALDLIRDEIDRLDRIIGDLLNFARPKQPRLERMWVKPLVRHWFPPVVEEFEKLGIQLVPQLEMDGEVMVDPDQLYQIFLNMMWNARDALRGHPNPHVFVRIEDGGDDFINLAIQDTGMGMLPEVLRQMREPFFTTKTQGTGLGVPVSIQLLEGMGGRFDVESVVEFGTTVTLRLPRAGVRKRRASDSQNLTMEELEAGR